MSSKDCQEVEIKDQLALSARAEGEVELSYHQEDNVSLNNVNNVDNVVIESANSTGEQSEHNSRLTRARKLTQKGQAYQDEIQQERKKEEDQLTKKFCEAHGAWETLAADIESSIADQLLSSQTERNEVVLQLKDKHAKVQKIYEKLRNIRSPEQETRQKMDTCDARTRALELQLEPQLCEDDRSSVRSRLSSKASTRSGRSRVSRSSKASSIIKAKKAGAAAELAAKEAELNALQEQAKQKEDIAKMEAQLRAETTRIETELARKRLELEKSEVKKQMEIAKAKLKVYQEVEEFEEDIEQVEDDILPKHLTGDMSACDSVKLQSTQQHENEDEFPILREDSHYSCQTVQPKEPSSNTTAAIVTAISESFSASRLPTPEPTIFSGEPIKYPDWKSSFHAIIHRKSLSSIDKLYYLKRYVSGPAKEAISGLFLQNSPEAYERAWKILDERFGHPFVVAKAYRDKLQRWPRIGVKDHTGLRRFADFLYSIETAMQTVRDLGVLNDYMENQKLLSKLPEWLISRWNREATSKMKKDGKYPDFKSFTSFVNAEADFLCNPISSCYAVKESGMTAQQDQNPKDGRSKTVHSAKTREEQQLNKTQKKQPQCTFCAKTDHPLEACTKFKTEKLDGRMKFVKENRLCFGCLTKGHMSSDCKKRLTCDVCHKKHPTCLHEERSGSKKKENKGEEEDSTSARKYTSYTSQGASNVSTSMIVPVWISSLSNPDKEVLVYAILDTQSDATFILKETCEELDAEKQPTKLRLTTITSKDSLVDSYRLTTLQVRGYKSDLKIPIPVAYTSTSIPADEDHIPTKNTATNWAHLQSIEGEMEDLLDCNVGLLIGYDCSQALTPRNVISGGDNEPYGIKTDLGWSIVGGYDVKSGRSSCHKVAVKELPAVTMNDIVGILESDFKENRDDKKTSQEDLQFLTIMEGGIKKAENGHYEMPLPFKKRPQLPDNRSMALTRLEYLKRKFQKDSKYKEDYVKFMNEILSRGDAEEAPTVAEEEGEKWYIPHHGVYHPKKNKIRVVFDCSARCKGTSLNDHLLSGPDLTNNLTGVLCRFRRYPYAVTCDVEKMFHQFTVCQDDRDYLRFLWWPNGDVTRKPKEFRMRVHLFGATSSPGCASYGFKHMASQEKEEYPSAAQFITHDFYVDDGLASVESAEEAKNLIEGAREVCKKGGLRLHKFISNDSQVLESVPKSERAIDTILDLPSEELPIERVLGVQWSVVLDCFHFSIVLKDQPLTRRGVLATVASVYDPLGFLAPLVLRAKKMLQEVCRKGVSWDEPLPEEVRPRWERWKLDLLHLKELQIPRCFEPKTMGQQRTYELHNFADASTFGYGQCSYLRVKDDNDNVNVSLVMGKSRVAPSKITTIPRLELTAAVVSAKVGTMLQDELNYANLKQYFWTDSKVVLGYISNDAKRFHTFVANRVQMIRSNTNTKEWRYVDTKNNPADHASRGLSAEELMKSSWFSGPAFLWEKEIPCSEEGIPDIQIGDPEVKATVRTALVQESFNLIDLVSRFSSWTKAVGVVSYLKRPFKKSKPKMAATTVAERQEAEMLIFKELQRTAFKKERESLRGKDQNAKLAKQSSLFKLDPFVDEQGMMRVGGRLESSTLPYDVKHPIILPRCSKVTEMIIDHFHKKVKHQGKGMTMNEIRSQGLWILGLNAAVASHIYKCVQCRRQRRPTESQKMANLPEDRVEPAPPFTYCGMDCFGPFMVKEGRRELKRYAVIFTCMSSRAVHIEQLDDMTTDAFINALRCFIAIRGPVQQLRCDQGSNFVGARNELAAAVKELDKDRIQSYLTNNRCEFVMNVPHSSHWGGVWERQIRTTRSILNTILGDYKARLDTSSLRTFLYEVMAIINSRPLTYQCLNDPKSLEPLTPNHLLTMKSKTLLPPPGNFVQEEVYARKRWRRVQYLAEQFWCRWRKEYLINLNSRQKWFTPKRNLEIGDVVIVQDDVPRNEWPLGKIMETTTDKQGLVRSVKIKLGARNSPKKGNDAKCSIIERPVQKVVLLIEDACEQERSNESLQ